MKTFDRYSIDTVKMKQSSFNELTLHFKQSDGGEWFLSFGLTGQIDEIRSIIKSKLDQDPDIDMANKERALAVFDTLGPK